MSSDDGEEKQAKVAEERDPGPATALPEFWRLDTLCIPSPKRLERNE